jgi:hypothetical protein
MLRRDGRCSGVPDVAPHSSMGDPDASYGEDPPGPSSRGLAGRWLRRPLPAGTIPT